MVVDDERCALRFYVCHAVRLWTALGVIRHVRDNELVEVLKDTLATQLRNMLSEFQGTKQSVGFKHGDKRFRRRLLLANEWFSQPNGPHARNYSGAHFQPFDDKRHTFQQFGYHGEREWKKLTLGMAACVKMMKIIDNNQHNKWWRELRSRIRNQTMKQFQGMPVPVWIESMLLDLKAPV